MKAIVFTLATLLTCATTLAKDEQVALSDELRALMLDLMQNTKVIATEVQGTAESYEPDGDPMTLEIVMLAKPSDGASHVSEDGEVIFLQPKTKNKEQQTLFTTAFYRKAQRRLAEPSQPIAPASDAPAEQ